MNHFTTTTFDRISAVLELNGIAAQNILEETSEAGVPCWSFTGEHGRRSFIIGNGDIYDGDVAGMRRDIFERVSADEMPPAVFTIGNDGVLLESEAVRMPDEVTFLRMKLRPAGKKNPAKRNPDPVLRLSLDLRKSLVLRFADISGVMTDALRVKRVVYALTVIMKILFDDKNEWTLGRSSLERMRRIMKDSPHDPSGALGEYLKTLPGTDGFDFSALDLFARELFEGEDSLFSILKRYAFYARENSIYESFDGITPTAVGYLYGLLLPSDEKKQKGIFYTGYELSDVIVHNALDICLKNRSGKLEDVLPKLRIADPGCGCGTFIVSYLTIISHMMHANGTRGSDICRVIKQCAKNLYCWDIDWHALVFTGLRIYLFTDAPDKAHVFSESFLDADGTLRFDLVIGNPPYVGHKGGSKELIRSMKHGELGKYNHERMDLYYYFFHKGIDLLDDQGVLAFVTTKYFLRSDSAFKLREDIAARTAIRLLIDFSNRSLFADAPNHNSVVTVLERNSDAQMAGICIIDSNAPDEALADLINHTCRYSSWSEIKNTDLFVGELKRINTGHSTHHARILSHLLAYPHLMNVAVISQGIVTGADRVRAQHLHLSREYALHDGVFVLSGDEAKKIFDGGRESELLKPWFKSSDIRRYRCNAATDSYLCLARTGFETDNAACKKHFLKYEPLLRSRNFESGELTKAGREGRWWSFSSSRANTDFSKPKIVAPQRNRRNLFGYAPGEWYASADVYFIFPHSDDFPLSYLLFYLNSKIVFLYLWFYGKHKGDLLELYHQPLSEIPVMPPDRELRGLSASFFEQIEQAHEDVLEETGRRLFDEFEIVLCRKLGLDDDAVYALNAFYDSR